MAIPWRARELETIRNFITGSSLTLVIDLFFTVVFFAVMYLFSPTLTFIVLGAICKNRTVFIIAHRLSAVRDASRIIVIDKGRIAEQGSHEALLGSGGHYHRLYAKEPLNKSLL